MKKYISNIAKLLEENPISYYWAGFILADGCISNNARLLLTLAAKDRLHLQKFKEFIEATSLITKDKRYNSYRIALMDVNIISQLSKKFDINSAKTYRPPLVGRMPIDNDLFLSLLIGFIDGDGCVARQTGRKDCSITIKCHNSWNNILQYFSNRLCKMVNLEPNVTHINKYGYAEIRFTNSVILKFLKNKAQQLSLPVLSRKWDLIDINFVSRIEQAKINLLNVKKLLLEDKRNKEISRTLKISPSTVTMIMKRNNLKYVEKKK